MTPELGGGLEIVTQKILQGRHKDEKNLSQTDIDAKVKMLTMDHSSTAGSKVDLQKKAGQLLRAGDVEM